MIKFQDIDVGHFLLLRQIRSYKMSLLNEHSKFKGARCPLGQVALTADTRQSPRVSVIFQDSQLEPRSCFYATLHLEQQSNGKSCPGQAPGSAERETVWDTGFPAASIGPEQSPVPLLC